MGCNCIDDVNKLLADTNGELVATFGFGGAPRRVALEVMKRETSKRQRPARVLASYCPFCGVNYQAPSTHQTGEPG